MNANDDVIATKPTKIFTGPAELANFADVCAAELLSDVQYKFQFPKDSSPRNWQVEKIKYSNEYFLNTLRHRANIYAIFIRVGGSDEKWDPVYVGQRKSDELRERVTQHLIKKSHQTGSMLMNVMAAVEGGKEVGLSFIKIQPESLRLFVEETIIAKYKDSLKWNTHG